MWRPPMWQDQAKLTSSLPATAVGRILLAPAKFVAPAPAPSGRVGRILLEDVTNLLECDFNYN